MFKFHVSLGCLLFLTLSILCLPQNALADPEIVGASKCKGCHKSKTGDQWKIWTESAHASAFETLASEESRKIAAELGLGDPQLEEACLKCHATKASLGANAVLSEKGAYKDSEGVGCESCHGPGSDYKPKKIMKDPEAARLAGLVMNKTADGCTGCHNEESPTFKGFEFEERWAEIAHPVPTTQASQTGASSALENVPDEIAFPSSFGDVLFSHSVHVKELEIECAECHHQVHAVVLDTPHPDYLSASWINCQSCHEAASQDSKEYYKCSDCHHSDPDDISDETLSSKVVVHKSCWKCHESGTGVQASHGCSDCHVKAKK